MLKQQLKEANRRIESIERDQREYNKKLAKDDERESELTAKLQTMTQRCEKLERELPEKLEESEQTHRAALAAEAKKIEEIERLHAENMAVVGEERKRLEIKVCATLKRFFQLITIFFFLILGKSRAGEAA